MHAYVHMHIYIRIALKLLLHRSLTLPTKRVSSSHEMQQQQQQQPPNAPNRPQIKPRTNVPAAHTPKTPDAYEYMSSKGVPQPEEDNEYDDPWDSVPRYLICMDMIPIIVCDSSSVYCVRASHDPYYSL